MDKNFQNNSLQGLIFLCFSQNVYWIALVSQNPPLLPWNVSDSIPALRHCPFCKTLSWMFDSVLNMPVLITVVICIATLCYVLHWTYSEFWHIQHSVFSGICQHIQPYSALLRRIHAYWDIIISHTQTYSGKLSTLCNPLHIHNLAIFWALWNVDQVYSELCHRALFSHIQNVVQQWYTQKPNILGILEYSEPIIASQQAFRTLSY